METKTYSVIGMHCDGCAQTIKGNLSKLNEIKSIEIDVGSRLATVVFKKLISLDKINKQLEATKYSFELQKNGLSVVYDQVKTYMPVILIMLGILAFTLFQQFVLAGFFFLHFALQTYMATFFIVFSLFKLINLKGFVSSFRQYDVIAQDSELYAYAYPFIELGLGIASAFNWQHNFVNAITITVMSIGSIGVIKALRSKRKIQCACLGGFFNLPMSKVALFEDVSMIVMAVLMYFV